MRTSTIQQGPLGLGGEYITIGNTIYNMESAADYANATGELKTFLDQRALDQAADEEMRRRVEAERVAWKHRGAGAVMVSVMQLRLAALAAGRLTGPTGLDAAIAALPDGEFKVRWQCMDRFTRADLQFLVPGTLTNVQANALFTAAQAL